MAKPEVIAFARRIEEDATLRARVESIRAGDAQAAFEQIAGVARDAGFDLSPSALEAGLRELSANELDPDELDSVTGGASLSSSTVPTRFAAVLHKVVPGWEPAGGINPCC